MRVERALRIERTLRMERTWNVQEVAWFVSVARGVDNPVTLEYRTSTANGKGLLGVVSLMMNVKAGEAVRLVVTGSGSSDAIRVLVDQLPVGVVVEPSASEKSILL
ncbi:HPr family phosphocarrier protein [Desmospora profundinema]|uniref:Phosphotransferase system HPr-like phosphotransfer protein n=1 Tax=Desmospora profundinema TaxID=1571184 RepID=A0ABU1INE7_9BACL|nr:HPr family phosphocarrier protein [Desmospora profundinema]MDR6226292.1 phosphotransferase system HPr-like phosphotransfer protein [Desmospora profundinema]